ncbi:MAG: nuclear transport factor 2 family protein [Burkholderiales bacterium]|nr:nuclear transport factor 2 family protein [Burkholderiales bacterium]
MDDAALIRAARERSNRAIAAHDLDAIAGAWTDDVHVLASAGTSSTGREANRQSLAAQFAKRPDTVYVRTPVEVDVFAAWGVAAERGDWVGRWTEPDGPLEIGGSYEAQWRRVDGSWLIRAELFVPHWCKGGAYCRAHPRWGAHA